MSIVDFENPPVVETVLGVDFAPLERLSVLHFGQYWAKIRDEFPHHELKPPLGSSVERYPGDEPVLKGPPQVKILNEPTLRYWFIDEPQDRLLQLQRDRFLHNWRKKDSPYPRYEESIRPSFEKEWSRYCAFLADQGIGTPEVQQCEVTYINHIPQGEGWNELSDVPEMFPLIGKSSDQGFLPTPDDFGLRASFPMPDRKGRLHVSLELVLRTSDMKQMIAFNLTARGRPDGPDASQVLAWLDIGREWVVQGFVDLTHSDLHTAWGMK